MTKQEPVQGKPHDLNRSAVEAVQSIAIAIDRFRDKPPRTFAQEWASFGANDGGGMIRISEIASVIPMGPEVGVTVTLRSGEQITAPDADYQTLKLTLMAASR